jgi:hypothetical protein
MKLLATFLLFGASVAWEIDPRCPDPIFARRLQEGAQLSHEEEAAAGLHPFGAKGQSHANRRLRGKEEQPERELQSSVPAPFQLKMFWQDYYCWQEEWIERAWCWACQGATCERGENLWLQFCNADDPAQKFNYIPILGSGGGQIQTASNKLCLDRTANNNFTLADCSLVDTQIYTGVQTDGNRFEIAPKGAPDSCLNQPHHPKAGEIIQTTTCLIARYWYTNEWTAYHGGSNSNPYSASNLSTLRVRTNVCTANRPCDICQGDCQTDDHCKGTMLCFQRSSQTQEVPGCFGKGIGAVGGENYCYNPDSPVIKGSGKTDVNGMTSLSSPGCSKDKPCGMCQGDCDNDDECEGNLVCEQKVGPGSATGCSGLDSSNSDFCVKPSIGVITTSPAPATTIIRTLAPIKTGAVLSIRAPECSKDKPCAMCQGDCDNDDECEGILICKQKDGPGSVEGCGGFDNSRTDFCTTPSGSVSSTSSPLPIITNTPAGVVTKSPVPGGTALEFRTPQCSKDAPCGLCQGDCDNDDECEGNLICQQKDGPGSVEGCLGYDRSKSDFCVAA